MLLLWVVEFGLLFASDGTVRLVKVGILCVSIGALEFGTPVVSPAGINLL